ncbi:hypothetical protein GJ744_008528 [Endocarpon pusillum]|uniref:Major facilitator superfamily (MFS) profile domain-containing protein n=1 Tax=Endocarpon pusillum TaxID=364733 RepID=A0A8H7AL53_9EURO|nr:hypothetical protein GJ744_008528 [Endocarpon pusillum]
MASALNNPPQEGRDGSSLTKGPHHPSPSHYLTPEQDENITDEPADFRPTTRFWLAIMTLAVLTLMVALDATIISVALPKIAMKLKGTGIQAFWAGTSFMLTATVFQPSYASFSHIFGRKPLILLAITFFLAGSLIGGLANDFTLLLIGRSLQGVGGGGITALTEIIITDLVPLRLRGQWFGIISAMWSVGSVSGPIIGGAFSQNVSWRWIFYLNLPFIGVGYVMVPLFLRLNFLPSSMASKLRRVDYFGTVVFVGSTTSFLIPVTWGGVMYNWSSWRTLVPLTIGVAGLVVFVLYETYLAVEPLIRLSIFQSRTASIAYATNVLHGMILWCVLYYLPLYFEAVKGYTPVVAGLALFPSSFTVAPAAVVIGLLITKTGKYRWSIILGWTLTTLGIGLLYLFDVDTSTVQWVFIMLVSGVGMGMLFPAMQFALQGASTNKDLAFAVAMFSFFRSFGNALGVAIGGSIFQNEMRKRLLASPRWADQAVMLAKDSAALVQTIKLMPAGTDKRDLQVAYAQSFRAIAVVLCALAGVSLILSLFIKSYDLNRALESEQGFMNEKNSKAKAGEEARREQKNSG